MVLTRRTAARRREQGARGGGGSDSTSEVGPETPGGEEMASAEIYTPVSMRMTRRTRSICKPEVIQESQSEELERAETKSDVSDSLEMPMSRNDTTTVHSAQTVAEPQADGDVSETESNCSAMSGLQTPLFVRVTRRRQIVVPYQLDSSDRKRQDKTDFFNKLSRILDEDDVSEAESCSSAISGVQMGNVTRTTRSKQRKKKLQPGRVHEVQSEDTSDAESCYLNSHVEPSITAKRITRSMQMKLQAENTKETEKGTIIVSENENVVEDTNKSEPEIISGCRPAAELVSVTDVPSVTEDNEEPGSPKSKCSSKSANAGQSEDAKEDDLNDVPSSRLREMKQSDTESPGKKAKQITQPVGAEDSEEACGHIQEEHSKVLVRKKKLESVGLSLTDCLSPKQYLESQGQITPNESKKNPEYKRADTKAAAEQSSTHTDKFRKAEQASAVSSPQKDVVVAQRAGHVGRCKMLEIDVGGSEDKPGGYAEAASHSSARAGPESGSFALFLSNEESDESENSDVPNADTVEENLCDSVKRISKEADERTSSLNKSSKPSLQHAEGLFVIDTEPGMSSSQKYYLDEVEQGSDAASKHEENEKGEEASDLEEADEEFIDEDEKDEDDDLLKNKIDVLHLSSSIDPGLNIKKLGGLYISFDAKKQKPMSNAVRQLKEKKKDQLLQKSIITPDFEKKECVPPFRESLHQLKKQRRAEREKTAGDGWFGMKAPEITSELKNDLKVLKMRASLDPKHFYKKNDRDGLPKYFQVGTVVDSPIDFYHSRIPKKQRKRTIVEELLADSEFRRYNKKKYQEIMSEKAAFAAGKRNRKKKKFHN